MVFESKFTSSQSEALEFVFLDTYFKPYSVNVAYQD